MWPSPTRRAWKVFELGAQALCSLQQHEMRLFIEEFFSLSGGRWQRFMNGSMVAGEVAETMWRVFAAAPNPLRAELIRSSARVASRALSSQLASAS
jgi:hypothetical protein